jgi:hypothetical protein
VAEDRQKTINRDDDGRLVRGARVIFDRDTEREAYHTAKLMKRLKPEYQRWTRMLAEAFLHEQMLQLMDPEYAVKQNEKGSA